jgi:hypothetical protein
LHDRRKRHACKEENMPSLSFYVVLGGAVCALLGGWGYFRHYAVSRPPIGVFNLKDIMLMVLFIILVPFLYLLLPLWVAAGLLVVTALSILYFTWEPVLRARWAIWLTVLTLLGVDVGTAWLFQTRNDRFLLVNNLVLIMLIVGISNLWAQSGMKARHAALLGALLAGYDVIATSFLPLTTDVFNRLAGLPLAPMFSWGGGSSALSLGLGDLLLATVFPLVMRKAFGRSAGIAALITALIALGTMLALPLKIVFPTMVVLGPLMVVQYLFWRKYRGQERTTWQYLQEEPLRHRKQSLNP